MATYVIHGKGTVGYAIALWALAALIQIVSFLNGGLAEGLWALPITAIIALIGFVLFWNPRLEVSDSGLLVVNIVRTFHIPWKRLKEVENRYGLYLYTTDLPKKVGVWGVPSRAGLTHNPLKNEKDRESNQLDWHADAGRYRRTIPLEHVADNLRDRARELAEKRSGSAQHSSMMVNSLNAGAIALALLLAVFVVIR